VEAIKNKITFVLLLVAAAGAAFHFYLASYHTLLIGFADINVFLYRTWDYLKTGELYLYREPLSVTYDVGRSVLKFPPLYVAPYLPWIDAVNGIDHRIYKLLFILHIARYILSFLLAGFFLGPYKNPRWWLALVILFSFCAPFYEALYGLTFDNLFLFLLVLSLVLIKFRKKFFPILLLSYAASLKIYPILQLLPFLLERNWKLFFYCSISFLCCLGVSLAIFGIGPHEFYFFHILPVLLQEKTLCETGNVSMTAQFCSYPTFTLLLRGFVAMATTGISLYAMNNYAKNNYAKNNDVIKNGERDFEQECLLFSFILCLPLILMKNVWGNYQIILLIPICVLLSRSFGKKGLRHRLPGLFAVLAWMPLLASDNYPAMNIPYYAWIDGALARVMIDHLKCYSALLLWLVQGCLLLGLRQPLRQ